MKTPPLHRIEAAAAKRATRMARKLGHPLTRDEILALKIQLMPAWRRWFLGACGTSLLVMAWFGWPDDGLLLRSIEAFAGVALVLFGIFGVRKTLGNVMDVLDAAGAGEALLELVKEAIGGVFH